MKTNIKMRVTPEQSMRVQEICFKNGIQWAMACFNKSNLDKPYIYIYNKEICYGIKKSFFMRHLNEEIDADLFIRTNGTCEEDTNYKSGDFLKCIVFYDIGVRVGSTYQIQEVDNYNSRISFLDDDLDTRSIEISRLNKYFKKVENKYTELSTSIDKPYNVPILESKLKKKNEILKKARIKRKNQREELNKLNLKLQKCIRLEEHHLKMKTVLNEKHKLEVENKSLKESSKISCNMLHSQKDKIDRLELNYVTEQSNYKKEIEKLKAVIEYLESKLKGN